MSAALLGYYLPSGTLDAVLPLEQTSTPGDGDGDTFDFIVVGAGPAGSILVCMLSLVQLLCCLPH